MLRKFLVALVSILAFTSVTFSGQNNKAAKAIQGTWVPVTAELSGGKFPDDVRKTIKLKIEGNVYTATVGDVVDTGTVSVNTKSEPRTMDIVGTDGPNKGKTFQAVYEMNSDTLRICYDLSGKSRPTEFKTTAGSQLYLVTYKRSSE